MPIRIHDSFSTIVREDWNRLHDGHCPFLQYEYLAALELSGSAAKTRGWAPQPLIVSDDNGRALGGIPLWLKSHSFGELVYDFIWANAYERSGLRYYPKLIAALPFSPVTGPRLLIAADADRPATAQVLISAARALADRHQVSSLHWLFTDDHDTGCLVGQGYLRRTGVQFQWHNKGYRTFADFLSGLTADKRKKLKRERRQVADAGIVMEVRSGDALTPSDWDRFYELYTGNIDRHGGMVHLTRDFFTRIGQTMPESIVLILARRDSVIVGAAFNLRGRDALYGRYWGGLPGIHSLHFETCYYAAIEYCIAQGLDRFEGGAGGEHKLARGFEPTVTQSVHWLRHPQFATAVADFLQREQHGIEHYVDELCDHVPFKTS